MLFKAAGRSFSFDFIFDEKMKREIDSKMDENMAVVS
jgi:hypothetical protein